MVDLYKKPIKAKSAQLRNLIILSVIVLIGIIALAVMLSDLPVSAVKEEKPTFASALNHIDAESVILETTQKALHETKKKAENLEEKLDSINNARKTDDSLRQKTNDELVKRIELLEKQLTGAGNVLPSQPTLIPGSESYQGNILPSAQEFSHSPIDSHANSGQGIREDNLSLTKLNNLSHQAPLKNSGTYVPAGTFVKAVMIGGADASAAVNSQSNPVPMIFRLIADGTLPNHKHSHLKDCVVTAAVIGDISSERGQIRLENLSCAFPNNEIVDQAVEGTVFGPEGKNGVRGTPLWRDGPVVQRAFTAGFLSGISNGVSSLYNTTSVSAQGTVQTLDSSKIIQNGLASGGSKSMDKLADYNIQRADQYHPVIQISAGTVVDVVFLKGFFLDGKKHENTDTGVGNYANSDEPKSSFFPVQQTELPPLPLSPENVRRIQEKSKELGYRVTTAQSAS